jgi:membrane associated rhomboid family serine protease
MKPFTLVAVVVFTLVALLQLLRVVLGWDVTINGFHVPAWASLVAFAVAALLAVMVWRENRGRGTPAA